MANGDSDKVIKHRVNLTNETPVLLFPDYDGGALVGYVKSDVTWCSRDANDLETWKVLDATCRRSLDAQSWDIDKELKFTLRPDQTSFGKNARRKNKSMFQASCKISGKSLSPLRAFQDFECVIMLALELVYYGPKVNALLDIKNPNKEWFFMDCVPIEFGPEEPFAFGKLKLPNYLLDDENSHFRLESGSQLYMKCTTGLRIVKYKDMIPLQCLIKQINSAYDCAIFCSDPKVLRCHSSIIAKVIPNLAEVLQAYEIGNPMCYKWMVKYDSWTVENFLLFSYASYFEEKQESTHWSVLNLHNVYIDSILAFDMLKMTVEFKITSLTTVISNMFQQYLLREIPIKVAVQLFELADKHKLKPLAEKAIAVLIEYNEVCTSSGLITQVVTEKPKVGASLLSAVLSRGKQQKVSSVYQM